MHLEVLLTVGVTGGKRALLGSWPQKGLDFQVGAAVSGAVLHFKGRFLPGASLCQLPGLSNQLRPLMASPTPLPLGEGLWSSCVSPALQAYPGFMDRAFCLGPRWQPVSCRQLPPSKLYSPLIQSFLGGEDGLGDRLSEGSSLLEPRNHVVRKSRPPREPATQLESQPTGSTSEEALRRFQPQPPSYPS